jgi:hypothetical protein
MSYKVRECILGQMPVMLALRPQAETDAMTRLVSATTLEECDILPRDQRCYNLGMGVTCTL